jgi:hypothetical protein
MAGAVPTTIAVTLTRAQWKALLALIATTQMSYTEDGIQMFNAFQTIQAAVGAGP